MTEPITTLKENLMNPPALEYPNYQISFCLSIYKKVFVLRIFTQKKKQRSPITYIGCYSQKSTIAIGLLPWVYLPC